MTSGISGHMRVGNAVTNRQGNFALDQEDPEQLRNFRAT
jgi:hypothetical protein